MKFVLCLCAGVVGHGGPSSYDHLSVVLFNQHQAADTMKHLNISWLFWSLSKYCGYRDRRRKGLKFQSWQSGAFLKAHSAPWLSAHTSDVSTRHELLACTLLHFVQSLGSVPVLAPKRWHSCWLDSFIPALPQPTTTRRRRDQSDPSCALLLYCSDYWRQSLCGTDLVGNFRTM